MKYGIIGDGRMAGHLKQYFSLLGIPVSQWSRRGERAGGGDLQLALALSDVIFILVKDGAIEPLIIESPFLQSKRLVHFSGALSTPRAQGMHPLMSFGPDFYSLETYQKLPFIVEAESLERADLIFTEIFPSLANPVYCISPQLKPYYHALCAMAGNFTVILWQKLFSEFEQRLGIPANGAFPYLRQTLENLEMNPNLALTGPIARRDWTTVERHMRTLSGDSFQDIYRSFLTAAAPDYRVEREI